MGNVDDPWSGTRVVTVTALSKNAIMVIKEMM